MCVLLYFHSGVCGVLVSDEVVVSGCGGVDHRGLGVVSGPLRPGRPRRATRRPLRRVRPEQKHWTTAILLNVSLNTKLLCLEDI